MTTPSPAFDLTRFGLSEMVVLGAELRRLGDGAQSMEEAAQRVARFFYERLGDGASGPACVLARCYETHSLGALPERLRTFARDALPGVEPRDDTTCLTLMGTFGDLPEWRGRQVSRGHQAIPLVSEEVVGGLPMVAELTRSLGLETTALVRPSAALLLEHESRGFNVFHVADAGGSPFVPAQAGFVLPFGVRSVVGFGFVLPPAGIVAVILFTRVPVNGETAQLFKTIALGLKLAMLPLQGKPTYEGGA